MLLLKRIQFQSRWSMNSLLKRTLINENKIKNKSCRGQKHFIPKDPMLQLNHGNSKKLKFKCKPGF